MGTRSDISVLYFLSPRLILIDAPSAEVTIQDLHDTLRDIEDAPANLVYPELISSAGKEDLGGGVLVGLTSTLQNAQVMFERRAVLLESGTVTTGGTGSPVQEFIDTSALFETNNISSGDIILNDTDNSGTEVLEVLSETRIKIFEPAGGTDNDFDIGDTYRVFKMVQCEISGGNLVSVDTAGSPISPIFPSFGTHIVRTSSSSATLQEQADIQYASFDGGVTVDSTSSYSGVVYPTGTPRQPVNNIMDAHTILNERGFDTFYVRGDLIVGSGIHPHLFKGQAVSLTTITLQAGADVDGARFERATVTGVLDGDAAITECFVDSLSFFNGVINSCVLSGTVTLGGGIEALILDSWSDVGGATIDMGGSGQQLMVQNLNGSITLTNKTGADDVEIGMSSGEVTIDNTVTNGTVLLTGVGSWSNELTYAGGATIVNRMLSVSDSQQIAFGGGVSVDTAGGTTGTSYPIGTQRQPSDNIPDAVSIASSRGMSKLFIVGNITLGGGDDVSGYIVIGQNALLTTITVNAAAVTTNSEFQECTLTGTLDAGVIVRNAVILDVDDFSGIIFQSMVNGTITLGGGSTSSLLSCYGGTGVPTIDMGGSGQGLNVRGYNGEFLLRNKSGADAADIDMNAGEVVLAATVTSGDVVLHGVGSLVDESGDPIRTGNFGGADVVNDLLSSTEIVATLDENTYDGRAFTDLMSDLLSMATGRIVESPAGTYTFYEQDNITTRFVLVKSGSIRSRV